MLEMRGASPGLLDDPLLLEVGGAAPNTKLTWRARVRDVEERQVVLVGEAAPEEGRQIGWNSAPVRESLADEKDPHDGSLR